jgi:hypothetical protein
MERLFAQFFLYPWPQVRFAIEREIVARKNAESERYICHVRMIHAVAR